MKAGVIDSGPWSTLSASQRGQALFLDSVRGGVLWDARGSARRHGSARRFSTPAAVVREVRSAGEAGVPVGYGARAALRAQRNGARQVAPFLQDDCRKSAELHLCRI